MQPTIVFRSYELLVPLTSTATYTEHLVRPLAAEGEGTLHRLRLGNGARPWQRAPEVGVRIHPHVLKVIDAGTHEGVDFVVYEHVQGVRLSDLLRSRTMAARPECAVAVVLDGLRAAQAYRAWRFESRARFGSIRRPITEDDVWIGVDGITRLSIVDLPTDDASADDERTPSLDVRCFGASLLALVVGDDALDFASLNVSVSPARRFSALAEVCARAIGESTGKRYESNGEMSLALHRIAIAERLIAPVEAVSSLVSMTFSERLAASMPRGEGSDPSDDEPTVVGQRLEFELDLDFGCGPNESTHRVEPRITRVLAEAKPARGATEAKPARGPAEAKPVRGAPDSRSMRLPPRPSRTERIREQLAGFPWRLAAAAFAGAFVCAWMLDSRSSADEQDARPPVAIAKVPLPAPTVSPTGLVPATIPLPATNPTSEMTFALDADEALPSARPRAAERPTATTMRSDRGGASTRRSATRNPYL